MFRRLYISAFLLSALNFSVIYPASAQTALTPSGPSAGPSETQPIIIDVQPIGSDGHIHIVPPAASAPAQTQPPAAIEKSPPPVVTNKAPPSAARANDHDTMKGLIIGGAILAIVLFFVFRHRDKGEFGSETHYDPFDNTRPRGRLMTDSERRDWIDGHRLQPTMNDDWDAIDDRRPLSSPNVVKNDVDPMKPTYHRQSTAQLILPSGKDKKSFADVAGQEEAVSRLREICQWLKQPEIFNRHNAELPRGILLVGPPGTGKTLCAQALAGETHGSMFIIAASSFVEMYVGVGASRVRALFADAKNQRRQTNKPVIIFIDELDAAGGARNSSGNSNSEREQTLNQLLVEMDGFTKNEGIIVMAATNRPDMLDAALRRKGRFDLEVHIDLPDTIGRQGILQVHTKDKLLDPSVDFQLLARRTFGMSGADLKTAANEAAIIAARHQAAEEAAERAKAGTALKPAINNNNASGTGGSGTGGSGTGGSGTGGSGTGGSGTGDSENAASSIIGRTTAITPAMFDEAVSIVENGEARRARFKAMTLEDKRQVAYHELGHAVVIYKTGGDPITKITILPRGRALGYVQTHTEGDRFNMNEVELRKRITAATAGRLAQQIFMQTVDTGAANDFEQANNLARKMVTQFGMSSLGLIYVPEQGPQPGPDLSNKIDEEVRKIVAECAADARSIIEANRQEIEALVDLLIEKETIFGQAFVAVFDAAAKARKD